MQNYIYKLKDDSGHLLYGFLEAQDKKDLKRKLRKTTYYFISAQPYAREKIFKKRIDLESLLMFTRRLSSLIESGVPILSAMHILWRQTEDKTLQLVISHIRKRLEEGKSIASAFEDFPFIFSPMYRAMIRVAEKAGGLVMILRQLTAYLAYQREVSLRTKKAMLYPVIVITFAFLVLICMFAFVVPTFVKVLLKLKVELPLLTKIVIGISELIRSWEFILAFAVIVGLGMFIYQRLRNYSEFSYKMDEIKLKLPVFGKLIHTISLSRFIHSLSILIGSGLPIMESFEVAKSTTSNQGVISSIGHTQQRIEQGVSLYDSFKDEKTFPVMLTEMIGVGESSGTIVESLKSLAAQFDQEVEYTQNKLLTLMEPILIIFVGIIVIITLLAVYLPIFSIWKGLLG